MQRASGGGRVHQNVYPLTWGLAISQQEVRIVELWEYHILWKAKSECAVEGLEGHGLELQGEILKWVVLLEEFV